MEEKLKVGVVTFHSAHNYGATLQAWALQKALKKIGTDPCLIHYHPDVIDRLYRVPKLDTLKKKINYAMQKNTRKRRKQQVIKYEKYTKFLQDHFKMVGDYETYDQILENPPGMDCYITGSDQVWNPKHTKGYDPTYMLEFAEENTIRSAYAASIGLPDFPKKFRSQYAGALQMFDAISVRERSSADAVARAAGKEVHVVLDPTLLLTREEYEEIKQPVERAERYILVYMMEQNDKLVELANSISVVTGLPIIQRRIAKIFKNEMASFYTDTPGEFLSEIENAEYVITNSFHGTVFSIIYQRPFISMLHSSTGSRTTDLLIELGLEDHILYQANDFDDMARFEIKDKEALLERTKKLREESLEFLKKAVKRER